MLVLHCNFRCIIIISYTTAIGAAVVKWINRLPCKPGVAILFSCPLGSWISLWNFEANRGSLIKPKWQKLASLAPKYAHSSFSSLVQSLLPRDTL